MTRLERAVMMYAASEWNEAEHPRGQPENVGEFVAKLAAKVTAGKLTKTQIQNRHGRTVADAVRSHLSGVPTSTKEAADGRSPVVPIARETHEDKLAKADATRKGVVAELVARGYVVSGTNENSTYLMKDGRNIRVSDHVPVHQRSLAHAYVIADHTGTSVQRSLYGDKDFSPRRSEMLGDSITSLADKAEAAAARKPTTQPH